jgi:hypothetical protein
MLIPKICMASIAVGLVLVVSCSSSKKEAVGDAGNQIGTEGGGVGAKCSTTSQCTGYGKPTCLTELKPLNGLISPDAGASAQAFGTLTVPFPGGYCSNTLADSCATDADCGAGAGCFRPFEGVDPTVIDNLGAALPFDIHAFANEGLCLKTCETGSSCRTAEGYKCIVPLHAFVDLFNSKYTKTFCVQDPDLTCYIKTCDGGK